MEDDYQLPPWLGSPALNTADDEETSPTIGMRMAGRVPPPSPAPAPPPPMPAVQFDPSRIPASIRPQPQSPSSVPVSPTGRPKLRDLLTDAIERYEIANGEIKWPQLATHNMQEAQEERGKQLLMSAPLGSGKAQ